MKKVLIEIPDDYLAKLNDIAVTSIYAEHIIKCGKVISEMTNGDVIKAMFPNIEIVDDFEYSIGVRLNNSNYVQFNKEWWNAPYKNEVEK